MVPTVEIQVEPVLKNPLLEEVIEDPLVARVLGGSTEALAAATRPTFLNNSESPVTWGPTDWEAVEARRQDIFDPAAIEEQLDPGKFLEEGYAVFEEVMTEAARQKWIEAVKAGQKINDALLRADWNEVDWEGLGRTPPKKTLTEEEIGKAIGGSQQLPQSDDEAGVSTLRTHGVFAEYFPSGHIPFLMDVLTHPQMLDFQRKCLAADTIYFDHNQLLTRPGGYPGSRWHSHTIGGSSDDCGTADLETYRAQPNINLTLCYPEGFDADEDGGLKIVKGSHLFRDPAGCRFPSDNEMEVEWVASRSHPVTGDPLKIERLSLPPGSVVCCLSHAAHAVAPKAATRRTRWCSLYCYKKGDDRTGLVLPPGAIPPVWAMKAQRGELPDTLTDLMRHSFDRTLTKGRVDSQDD